MVAAKADAEKLETMTAGAAKESGALVKDRELVAMARATALIGDLDPEVQERVMVFLNSRFPAKSEVPGTVRSTQGQLLHPEQPR